MRGLSRHGRQDIYDWNGEKAELSAVNQAKIRWYLKRYEGSSLFPTFARIFRSPWAHLFASLLAFPLLFAFGFMVILGPCPWWWPLAEMSGYIIAAA